MSVALSRKSLFAVVAALAMAFALALTVYTHGARAQAEKFYLCHNTGSATNPFVAIPVDDNSIPDAHTGHGDFILGPVEDFPSKPDADAACNASTTTTDNSTTDNSTTTTDNSTTTTDNSTTTTDVSTTGATTGATTTGATTGVTTGTTVTQVGNGNIACVQTAVQQNVVSQGNGNAQASGEGDNVIDSTNVSAQAISQECNITVTQANTILKKFLTVNKAGKVKVVKASATATASASAAAPVQYKVKKVATASASAAAPVQYKVKKVATASASAAAPVQYQYASPSASASAPAVKETELPETGGTSLLAIGAMVLLLGGGLTALFAVRRGTSG